MIRRTCAVLAALCLVLAACDSPVATPAEDAPQFGRSLARGRLLDVPPLAAAASVFRLKPSTITSYASGTGITAFGIPIGLYAYSMYDGENTTFQWYLQNREDSGTPRELLDNLVVMQGAMFEGDGLIDARVFTVGDVEAFSSDPDFAPGAAVEIHDEPPSVVFEFFTLPATQFWGCTVGAPDPESDPLAYWRTCLGEGIHGWLVFEVVVSGRWTLDQIETDPFTLPLGPVDVRRRP